MWKTFFCIMIKTLYLCGSLNLITMYTKDLIQEKIKTDLNWTIRTLEVLFSRQTTDEQVNLNTVHRNGRGFNGRDSEILTSFYFQVEKRKRYNNPTLLSDRQVEVCRKLLPKYWKQIKEEIELKQGNN
jgi:hypothetical protein